VCEFGLVVIVVLSLISGIGPAQAAGSGGQASPSIRVAKVNADTVKKYEKFEIEPALAGVDVKNPYDPEEIDVFANFTSPDGKTIRINGFYDNYQSANQWKLRFAPNTVGQWRYQVFVHNGAKSAQTTAASFTAEESDRHGWIRPSKKSPHYFACDDGTSYYGVGAYSPWGNTPAAFDAFAECHANFLAIWDIDYGGYVNGLGILEPELGRYNQEKCGRLDEVLERFEQKDIKMMLAIWPHDLFSATVWAAKWSKNPYSQICNVVDVYSDPRAWQYQKKKYRYLVARFGHSPALGVWELINEMNGTDGWARGNHQACYDWVAKCDKWFAENDPYHHPMTASFSGGYQEYRAPLYSRNDIANLHVYPYQGWPAQYPDDNMRSEIYNYAWASRRFWNHFEKPAIFGEAGIGNAFRGGRRGGRGAQGVQTSPSSGPSGFNLAYHNVIWASLSNGLAATPMWWTFRNLGPQDQLSLKYLAQFVSDIDLANLPYKPAPMSAEGADAWGLATDTTAFGWLWSYAKGNIGGTLLTVAGLTDGSFTIRWFDPWAGVIVKTENGTSAARKFSVTVPDLSQAHRDIAFKIDKK
jgi:hypothetical protein